MPKMFYAPGRRAAGQKVFLATPAYGGVCAGFSFSLFHSAEALRKAGIAYELALYTGDCHVDDARNRLVRDFLETDCTDLVFIDSDLRWDPADLVKLLEYDRDVVGATYPFKQDETGFPVAMTVGDNVAEEDGLVEVNGLPTGFLRIKRQVLQTLSDLADKFRPKSDSRGDFPLIFERQLHNGYRRGGDYAFCRKWADLGGKLYLAPEFRFEHYGESHWKGSFGHWKRMEMHGPMMAGIMEIRSGVETIDTLNDMWRAWNNEWAAPPDMVYAAAALSRKSEGDVLECGSGLTTLALAAANPNVRVVSLEHDEEWAERIKGEAKRLGLKNIEIVVSPLDPKTMWYSHKPTGEFSLVVIDGPPRYLGGNRNGVFDAYDDEIRDSTVIMDDTDDTRQMDIIKAWAGETPVHTFGNNERSFSIVVR